VRAFGRQLVDIDQGELNQLLISRRLPRLPSERNSLYPYCQSALDFSSVIDASGKYLKHGIRFDGE